MSDTLHGYSKAVIRQKKKRETSAFPPPHLWLDGSNTYQFFWY